MKFTIYVTLAVVMLLSVAVGYQFRTIAAVHTSNRTETCQAFQKLDDTFARLIRAGEKEAAALAYYREHPDELRIVIAADEHNIAALEASLPTYC